MVQNIVTFSWRHSSGFPLPQLLAARQLLYIHEKIDFVTRILRSSQACAGSLSPRLRALMHATLENTVPKCFRKKLCKSFRSYCSTWCGRSTRPCFGRRKACTGSRSALARSISSSSTNVSVTSPISVVRLRLVARESLI